MTDAMGDATNGDDSENVRRSIKSFFDAHGRRVVAPRSGIFLLEGSASTEVYLIESGIVQISSYAANGKHSILREMGAGEIFGEMAAIDGQPRSASVSIVSSQSSLYQITAEQFRQLLMEHPEVALWLTRELANRIRDLTQRTVELATMSVSSRLQSQILKLCERDGVDDDVAIIEPLPTHSELAAMIGTNREAVTRELRELARENLVSQVSRQMTVNSVSQLSKLPF